jgi:hypothetical protein
MKNSNLFNIATLAVAASAAIHLKDAEGTSLLHNEAGEPLRIRLHSPGSKAFGAVEARQSARAVKRMNDNDGKIATATADERVQETAEDLADVTIGFEGFTYGDGSLQGRELFLALYADQSLGFITRQVIKALGDWGKFKAASAAA